MAWHVDPIKRCRHTSNTDCGVEDGACRSAFLRHVYDGEGRFDDLEEAMEHTPDDGCDELGLEED